MENDQADQTYPHTGKDRIDQRVGWKIDRSEDCPAEAVNDANHGVEVINPAQVRRDQLGRIRQW